MNQNYQTTAKQLQNNCKTTAKQLFRDYYLYLLTLVLMASGTTLFSQSIFIPKLVSQISFTTEKQDRLARVENVPHDGALQYAEVGSFIS